MKKYLFGFFGFVLYLVTANACSGSEITGNLSTGLNTAVGDSVNGIVVIAPSANPPAGTYSSVQTVNLAASGSDSIRYTTNSIDPSCSTGILYSAPIEVASSLTVKAVACYSNHASSVTSFPYSIQQPSGGGGGGVSLIPTRQGRVLGINTSSHHPNGTLVLDGQTIFLIRDGNRAGFRNPEEYFSHGYRFDQAVPANDADLSLPAGEIIKALEGTLAIDDSDNRTVYMVGLNGTKRGFTSELAFRRLGYMFGGLPTINLTDYPKGEDITEEALVHPEGALVLNGATVWWLRNGRRMGFESEQVFNTYGFSFGRVVDATSGDLSLPEGAKVKFRDGTLAKDVDCNYLISDGKKMMFANIDALISRGYKLENLVVAALSDYEAGETLE